MFKKPPVLQSRTQLKSSASRAVTQQIAAAFPQLTPEDMLLLFPSKAPITCDKLSSPPHTALYSLTPSRPLFFSYLPTSAPSASSSPAASHLCPTVYALWLCPHLLPPVFIHPSVSSALIRGADLMLPGVLRPASQPYHLSRGQLRSIVARGNPAPVAVGEVAVDEAEAVAAGWVGKGVRVLQCYGDGLYGASERVVPNEGFVGAKVEAVIGTEEARAMLDAAIEEGRAKGQAMDELEQLREQADSRTTTAAHDKQGSMTQKGGASQTADTVHVTAASTESKSAVMQQAESGAISEQADDRGSRAVEEGGRKESASSEKDGEVEADDSGCTSAVSTERAVPVEEMDRSLVESLLFAIKTDLADDVFPLPASVLLSRYMEACNPYPHRLELKHSSYKKMSKFVKAMQKQSLLFTKEKQGELAVTSVHRQHPDVLALQAGKEWNEAVKTKAKAKQRELKERERRREEEGAAEGASGGLIEVERRPLQILHRYKPSAQLRAAVLSDSEDELLTMREAKQQLADYCRRHGLDEGGSVRLDAALAAAVMSGSAAEGSCVSKAALARSFESQLTLYSAILLPTHSAHHPAFHRGDAPPITVTVEQRAGNRTVTRLSGLDRYGVDVIEWGREAARHYAASVTSEESKGGKKGARDVLVQGDCREGLAERLWQQHAIPRDCVTVEAKRGKGKR